MLVTCPECGTKISQDADPCPQCGKSLAGASSIEFSKGWQEEQRRIREEYINNEPHRKKERERAREEILIRDKEYKKYFAKQEKREKFWDFFWLLVWMFIIIVIAITIKGCVEWISMLS